MIEEIKKMQSDIETVCSENPEEILNRISDIMVIIARSGLLLADAKKICSVAKRKFIWKEIMEPLASDIAISATTQKALIDSFCADEQYIVDWLERINRTATHQLDALRSMLSYEKEHLRLTLIGTQNGN